MGRSKKSLKKTNLREAGDEGRQSRAADVESQRKEEKTGKLVASAAGTFMKSPHKLLGIAY